VGDESLTVRPMERIRKPLELMGARIDLTEGHAPMVVHGGKLKGIDFEAPIASAQVKTAVLFAGLQAEGVTSIAEKVRTRDHSEHALRAFGASWSGVNDRLLRLRAGRSCRRLDATVPGDMSSAAFFLCAALLFEDSNLVLDGLGMNPTRAAMLDVISAMGGVIKVLDVAETHGEMVGTIQVNRGRMLRGLILRVSGRRS
jgi:3-phosphoshikimate 1-carboxyvinyltransferase